MASTGGRVRCNEVAGFHGGSLKLRVQAAPLEGEEVVETVTRVVSPKKKRK